MRLLTLLTCFFAVSLSAQTLSGTVTDESTGEPLPFASIFVKETGAGAVTNQNGRYQLTISGGTKTLVFQYLGYQSKARTVYGSEGNLDVSLIPEALDLQEVEVLSSGEDLSYSVIRRAIAKADYHRNQVDYYSADVYLKATGKVKKIPKLYLALAPKEDREEVAESMNRDFTGESISKIVYERPNKFKQEVISKLEIGDSDFDATNYIFSSFYQPEVADIVSPLSPRAFAYYKFAHEGTSVDQGVLINKIKVIPRSRGEDVFEGYVYVVQDDWSLHSLNLRSYRTGFTVDIQQQYQQIVDRVWLPTTMTIKAAGKIFGVELEGRYVSSTTNYEVRLNEALGGYVEVIDEKTQPEAAAMARRKTSTTSSEAILQDGGEITRKDLRKLMKTYQKEEREKRDEPKVVGSYDFKDDSTKVIRDTAYWATIRPIPLTATEKVGYAVADSLFIKAKKDSVMEAENEVTGVKSTEKKRQQPKWLRPFDFEPMGGFDPVRGYYANVRLSANIYRPKTEERKRKQITQVGFKPEYGFSSERFYWEADALFGSKANAKKGLLRLVGGRGLRQFDPNVAILPQVNTLWALLGSESFIRLYERDFGGLSYRKQYSDAFGIKASLGYEDRRAVSNNSDHTWFGGGGEFRYRPNVPVNLERGAVASVAPAATVSVEASFRPGLKYFYRNGKKRVASSSRDQPTLTARLNAGVPDVGESVADFTLLEASYEQRFEVGRKGAVSLLLRGGAFLNNQRVDFPDFRHFATSEIFLTQLDPIGSYRLLPYYALSTQEEYLEFYGHYQFRKFLFSRIWKLHLMGLKEDLFVNYLNTPESEHYFEAGYSLDNIFRIARLEFITSFRDGKYEDFGVRLSVSTNISTD